MNRHNPTLEEYLPKLMNFLWQLSEKYVKDEIANWKEMVSEVDHFFSRQYLDEIEQVLPGWGEMTSYADGITQAHTIGVLVAIMTSPEYKGATDEQKNQMEWSGLLHDISKRVVKGQSDLTHAIRSGGPAVRILLQAGFWHQDYTDLESWIALTSNAVRQEGGQVVQDNRKLPEIMDGLEAIFGENKAALNIMKAVIFHWSFTTLREWPCAAPISAEQVRAYLDDESLQILIPLILADSDSWNLFDQDTKHRYRAEIAESLSEIEALLGTPST